MRRAWYRIGAAVLIGSAAAVVVALVLAAVWSVTA